MNSFIRVKNFNYFFLKKLCFIKINFLECPYEESSIEKLVQKINREEIKFDSSIRTIDPKT